ncbi:MAG: hypothetical protein LUC22_06820 [Prevotella sp.]|nr:hypothetical protein [Prevotella sp.]
MKDINTNKNITRANPFTVPDGYFERLKSDILARVAECDAPKIVALTWQQRLLRPLVGLAATLCVAVFGATIYAHKLGTEAVFGSRDGGGENAELFFSSDDADDYIMLDNDDIYRYLAEADWE